jgi:DNA polymerase III delta prime subunit
MLPWTETYRPKELEHIIFEPETERLFYPIVEKNFFPNMLFYGPPGTGKTTTIMCLLKRYQETYGHYNNVIHLNASDERGIEVIRNHLYTFVHSRGLFNQQLKFVVLDEVDSMTKQAQTSLLHLMTVSNVRFCLICNYISKLIPDLRDYMLLVPFYNTFRHEDYIQKIIDQEKITIDREVIEDIKMNYYPDMRSFVNCLQLYQSYPFPILNNLILKQTCEAYDRATLERHLQHFSLKEFLTKLFLYMMNYTLDTSLIHQMKDLLLLNPDLDYFHHYFMPAFQKLNSFDKLN